MPVTIFMFVSTVGFAAVAAVSCNACCYNRHRYSWLLLFFLFYKCRWLCCCCSQLLQFWCLLSPSPMVDCCYFQVCEHCWICSCCRQVYCTLPYLLLLLRLPSLRLIVAIFPLLQALFFTVVVAILCNAMVCFGTCFYHCHCQQLIVAII